MTRTARYNAKTNTFRELPGMEKPIRPNPFTDSIDVESLRQYRIALNNYESQMPEYQKHLASLREIPCHESCRSVFKDQGVYEEGKDFEVKDYCPNPMPCFVQCKDCVLAYSIVPVQSEDELWNDVFLAMHKKAQGYKIISGINHPGLPNHKPWHDEMIAELKKHFALTPR